MNSFLHWLLKLFLAFLESRHGYVILFCFRKNELVLLEMTFSLCYIASLFVYVHGTIGVAKISFVPRMNTQSGVSCCNLTGISTVELKMNKIHYISFHK